MRLLAVFVLVPMLGGVIQFGGFSSRAQLEESGGVIQPPVLAALQEQPEVAVIIQLVAPPLPLPGQLTPIAVTKLLQDTQRIQEQVLALLTPSDFTLTYQYSVLPVLAGRISGSGLQKLQGRPEVEVISLDDQIFAMLGESVPLIRASEVHDRGVDGSGVTVAVLDSGITHHDDLADSIVGEECFADCPNDTNRESGSGSAEDTFGHGTFVSGIITSNGITAGLSKGVAPNAAIFAYRVLGGPAGLGTDSSIGGALDHILNLTIQRNASGLPPLTPIINMSLGDPNGWPDGACSPDHPEIDSYLGILRLYGVLAFAASGNGGIKDGISWPACSPAVVSVGGVYDADIGARTWSLMRPFPPFECTDATTWPDKVMCRSNSRNDLDLLAPGAGITSSWPVPAPSILDSCWDPIPGALTCGGTSAASPHAVGVAALVKQAMPGITPDQIEEVLERTGRPVADDYDPNNVRTTPRVDARAALFGNILVTVQAPIACAGGQPSPECTGQPDGTVIPGAYYHCISQIQHDEATNDIQMPVYCYTDIPGVDVNPEDSPGVSGDGLPGVPPPLPLGDVDGNHTVLTGTYDKANNRLLLSGCFEDKDQAGAQGNVYWDADTGQGTVDIYINQAANCTNSPSGTAQVADILMVEQAPDYDYDRDGCSDKQELGDGEGIGGLRDPYNPWDFYDVNGDQFVSLFDDIYAVAFAFGTGAPGRPNQHDDYARILDRGGAMTGANAWNQKPPDGKIDMFNDILGVSAQFGHRCT